jgi:hypothetical protein
MNAKSKAKVIRLPGSYPDIPKQRPLSKLMIATLLNACIKQHEGIPFGQADIDGPFSVLVARGLLRHKNHNIVHHTPATWVVTDKAFEMLQSQGIRVPWYH